MVDVAELPLPVLAADEIDEAGVIVVGVLEEGSEKGLVGDGEIRPLQGLAQVHARPDRCVDRPVVGVAGVKDLAGVPKDCGPAGEGSPGRRTEVRGR